MKISHKSQGYVLAIGLIILFLASLLSFSVWNTARLSLKAAVNYQQKIIAKEAAFIALRKAQEKLEDFLKRHNCFNTFLDSKGFYAAVPLPENGRVLFPQYKGLAFPYREAAWNDQNSQTVKATLLPEYKKPPHFFIEYLGGKNTELFYFRVVVIGWSTVESSQVLTAYYQFKRGTDGSIQGGRRALYVF